MSEEDYQKALQDLPRRRKVWPAIADLQFKPPDFEYVVRTCRESGYSWDELDRIARYEVASVVWFTWEEFQFVFMPYYDYFMSYFFDDDWVVRKVLKRMRWRHHALMVKFFGRRMMSGIESDWREVERRFKGGEGAKPHPGD